MLSIYLTKKYKKSLKKYQSFPNFSIEKLDEVILKLQNHIPLDKKYKDHALKGVFQNSRECHIYSNILLIYKILDKELILILVDISSHSELF
jgi:mRNA interferase YafQ